MNGLRSPMTTHWSTTGDVITLASNMPGDTFLPPAVMIRSFLRPVMVTNPSSSMSPRSPVCNHPSTIWLWVISGWLWYPTQTARLLMHSSPSSPSPTDTPCSGRPTVPMRYPLVGFTMAGAQVSVMPYPSSNGSPTPLKKCAMAPSRGAPPDTAYSQWPPNTPMIVR